MGTGDLAILFAKAAADCAPPGGAHAPGGPHVTFQGVCRICE